MPTIVTCTYSSNEHYNADGDFALITITPADAQEYLRLIDAFLKARGTDNLGASLYKSVLWNNDAYYLTAGLDDVWEEEVYDTGVILADTDPRVAAYRERAIRMECETINVCDDRVYWQAIPKHSSVRLESGSVSAATLKEIAACDAT